MVRRRCNRGDGGAIGNTKSNTPTSKEDFAMNTSTVMGQGETVADSVDLDLNVTIVTAGPVAAALLSSTDDGCDTVRGSDC
jgi:FxLD family lantipeptide